MSESGGFVTHTKLPYVSEHVALLRKVIAGFLKKQERSR